MYWRSCMAAALLMCSAALAGGVEPADTLVIDDSSNGGMELQSFFSRLLENSEVHGDLDIEIKSRPGGGLDGLNANKVVAVCGKSGFDSGKYAEQTYAYLPILVAVPADSVLDGLSVEDLRRIYSGRVNSWSRLNGSSGDILRGGFAPDSSVGRLFDKLVMHSGAEKAVPGSLADEIAPGMVTIRTAQAAETLLQAMKGVIVFGGWNIGKLNGCKVLKINNIAPTRENILSGKYPLAEKHSLIYLRRARPTQLNDVVSFLQKSARKSGIFVVPEGN